MKLIEFMIKYLGIVLDDSLTWKDHVRYVISKVGKRVDVLGHLRRNITIHTAFEMYNALILSIFDYYDVVWSSCNKADIESLESLQRRASKIIVKSKRGTCLLYTSPSPRDGLLSRMPSSA